LLHSWVVFLSLYKWRKHEFMYFNNKSIMSRCEQYIVYSGKSYPRGMCHTCLYTAKKRRTIYVTPIVHKSILYSICVYNILNIAYTVIYCAVYRYLVPNTLLTSYHEKANLIINIICYTSYKVIHSVYYGHIYHFLQ
jgi:hypothetical protein